jgi:hypothetical protein
MLVRRCNTVVDGPQIDGDSIAKPPAQSNSSDVLGIGAQSRFGVASQIRQYSSGVDLRAATASSTERCSSEVSSERPSSRLTAYGISIPPHTVRISSTHALSAKLASALISVSKPSAKADTSTFPAEYASSTLRISPHKNLIWSRDWVIRGLVARAKLSSPKRRTPELALPSGKRYPFCPARRLDYSLTRWWRIPVRRSARRSAPHLSEGCRRRRTEGGRWGDRGTA